MSEKHNKCLNQNNIIRIVKKEEGYFSFVYLSMLIANLLFKKKKIVSVLCVASVHTKHTKRKRRFYPSIVENEQKYNRYKFAGNSKTKYYAEFYILTCNESKNLYIYTYYVYVCTYTHKV